jgi:putative hydrolase of the HAD superfamily
MTPPAALLLDLGNVVLEVDFRRVFDAWAVSSGVSVERFHERWDMDRAYREHETGACDFANYTAALADRFEVAMSAEQWRAGWNAIFVRPYDGVVARLPEVARRLPLYAFTNTNAEHHRYWASRYRDELASFRHMFVSSEIGLRKPDREAFHHVVEAIGVPAESILFLDDSRENVDGARDAGLAAALIGSAVDVERHLDAVLSAHPG